MAYALLLPLCIDPLYRVTSSAQGIYSIMNNISSYSSYPDIISSLRKLDIEASVRVLVRFIKELDVKHKTKSINESIILLKECMEDIEKELLVIHEKLVYNRSIWFMRTMRSYTFKSSIDNLETLKRKLDNRSQMFFSILKNNHNLAINESVMEPNWDEPDYIML